MEDDLPRFNAPCLRPAGTDREFAADLDNRFVDLLAQEHEELLRALDCGEGRIAVDHVQVPPDANAANGRTEHYLREPLKRKQPASFEVRVPCKQGCLPEAARVALRPAGWPRAAHAAGVPPLCSDTGRN